MKKFVAFIALILVVLGFSYTPAGAATSGASLLVDSMTGVNGPIGNWIAADGGVPVTLKDGSTLLLFGDTLIGPNDGLTVPDAWMFVNSSALHIKDGVVTPINDLLPRTEEGHFYWITDGRALPDGSMSVFAVEMYLPEGGGAWDFKSVDTDMFWVENPLDRESWQNAMKIDTGWWDPYEVNYLDGNSDWVAFQLRDSDYDDTMIASEAEMRLGLADKISFVGLDSDSPAPPVQFNGSWYVTTWCLWSCVNASATLWSAPTPIGPWTHEQEWPQDNLFYLAQTHVIEGELVVQWSNNHMDPADIKMVEDYRPTYEIINNV